MAGTTTKEFVIFQQIHWICVLHWAVLFFFLFPFMDYLKCSLTQSSKLNINVLNKDHAHSIQFQSKRNCNSDAQTSNLGLSWHAMSTSSTHFRPIQTQFVIPNVLYKNQCAYRIEKVIVIYVTPVSCFPWRPLTLSSFLFLSSLGRDISCDTDETLWSKRDD